MYCIKQIFTKQDALQISHDLHCNFQLATEEGLYTLSNDRLDFNLYWRYLEFSKHQNKDVYSNFILIIK